MTTHPIAAMAVSLIALLLARAFFAAELSCAMSPKARKAYRTQVPLGQRLLMRRAPEFVRDQYSKTERRTIRHTVIARCLRAMTVTLFAMLLAAWSVFALCAAGVLPGPLGNVALRAYLIAAVVCILASSIADEIIHRQFWRIKRKP